MLASLVAGRLDVVAAAPLDDAGWLDLRRTAQVERIVPTLAIAARNGVVPVTNEQRDEIEEDWTHVMRQCLLIESHLVWVSSQLEAMGVEHRVLKGAAAAHLDRADPSMRQFSDIDLLVRGDDMGRAIRWFEANGFRRKVAEFRPGFDRRYVKSVTLGGPVEVDLHRTLAHGPIGPGIPLNEVWCSRETFEVGGTAISALGREARILQACLHAHLDPPPTRLSTLEDVAVGLRDPSLDSDAVRALAARWRIGPVLEAAVQATVAELWWPSEVATSWWRDVAPSPQAAALIASHRDRSTPSSRRSLLSLVTMPGIVDRVRFATWLAVPVPRLRERLRRAGRGKR